MTASSATRAQIENEILPRLYTAASRNAGVVSFTIDGMAFRFQSSAETNAAIQFWEGRLARLARTRPMTSTVDLRRAVATT